MQDEVKEAPESLQEVGADGWRERMLFVATELLKTPDRALTTEEADEMRKATMALAEMVVVMDEKLCQGYVPPRAWMRDVPLPGQLPSSDLHKNLKAEADVITQKMLEICEQHVAPHSSKSAKRLLELLTKLLQTLALFTSESVRLACMNNLKPEEETTKPHLALVHDAGKEN